MASCTCWIGSCRSTWARPSSAAVVATAMATAAETERRSVIGGNKAAPGLLTSDSRATASAAAAIIRSLIRVALATTTPRPNPGEHGVSLGYADPDGEIAFGYTVQRTPYPGGADSLAVELAAKVRKIVLGTA